MSGKRDVGELTAHNGPQAMTYNHPARKGAALRNKRTRDANWHYPEEKLRWKLSQGISMIDPANLLKS